MASDRYRMAYFNGRFVPEKDVLIPFRDLSVARGYAGFDVARTFKGRTFKLKEHIDRFFDTLRYLDIDSGLTKQQFVDISEEVVAVNRHLLGEHGDYWVAQRVTAGLKAIGDEGWEHTGPNVIVECHPIPFAKRAVLFRDGIRVITPASPRTPPSALSPRAKMHQYLNLILASNDVKRIDPDAWPLLLDVHGNLAEGQGSNIFLVKDGVVRTPRAQFVLPGVSRATALEIAADLGYGAHEADLDLYDAAVADEIFITSTSLCVCPVSSFNGRKVECGVPGPITSRIQTRYSEIVGHDFVQQHMVHLNH